MSSIKKQPSIALQSDEGSRNSILTRVSNEEYKLNEVSIQVVKLPKYGSQRYLLLEYLVEAKGFEVGLDQLVKAGNCVNVSSQMSHLRRKYGANVENREEHKGMIVHSFYTLHNWKDYTSLLEGGVS